ncbi:hypothetical protein D3C86_1694170 [compost metagenome]
MPMVRDGRGSASRNTETVDCRVSISTAICGMSVTPMPAPTICTRVESEEPSISTRGGALVVLQKESAWLRKQWPSSSNSRRISPSLSALGTGMPASSIGRTRMNSSENSGTSSSAGSETGNATIAMSSRASRRSSMSFCVTASRGRASSPG